MLKSCKGLGECSGKFLREETQFLLRFDRHRLNSANIDRLNMKWGNVPDSFVFLFFSGYDRPQNHCHHREGETGSHTIQTLPYTHTHSYSTQTVPLCLHSTLYIWEPIVFPCLPEHNSPPTKRRKKKLMFAFCMPLLFACLMLVMLSMMMLIVMQSKRSNQQTNTNIIINITSTCFDFVSI